MSSENTIAIIVPDASDRTSLHNLLVAEGFVVEDFSRPEGFVSRFVNSISTKLHGCLIIDLDHSEGDSRKPSLVDFAITWSQKIPCIVIASDPARLPSDPLLPTAAKSSGETRLLYLIYGALSEPAAASTTNNTRC